MTIKTLFGAAALSLTAAIAAAAAPVNVLVEFDGVSDIFYGFHDAFTRG